MEYTKNFYINMKEYVEELPRPTQRIDYPVILLDTDEDPKGRG